MRSTLIRRAWVLLALVVVVPVVVPVIASPAGALAGPVVGPAPVGPAPVGPAPGVSPALVVGPAPATGGTGGQPAGPGVLPGGATSRDLGLPVVLAAVLAVGVGSLVVRVLLAEPAARRRGPDTVD